jgi:hypothetical protein
MSGLTTDQKQKIRRDHAAATIRQLATVLDQLHDNIMDNKKRYDYQAGARALRSLASDISDGKVNPRRWEFMTWIMEPKDLDSHAPDAIYAKEKSFG